MKHAPLLLLLAAGGVFGWFAPDLAGDSRAGAPATSATPVAEAAQATVPSGSWGASETVLARAPDGHFYADVSVQGVSVRMLVDTGASVIALTAEDADAFGVAWSETDIGPVAKGANGTVYGVPTTLEDVRVGEIEARRVDAVVVPDGLGISLLGQSFLSQAGRVGIVDDRMTLGG